MAVRTTEDKLREEYFALLPDVRRVIQEVEAQVRYCLLPMLGKLRKHESLIVTSRVKDCESALGALRRRQEGKTFDADKPDSYTLTDLKDLAGIRVLAFPRDRWLEANNALRQRFSLWTADPVLSDDGDDEPLAFKYHGFCATSATIRGEVQIAPRLVGMFWEVEHSAIYKPSPELVGVVKTAEMKKLKGEVLAALKAFDNEIERLVRSAPVSNSGIRSKE